MANNCLVTKLKSVIDNDTLPKLGDFVMYVDTVATGNDEFFILRAPVGTKITVSQGGGLSETAEGLSNPVTSLTVNENKQKFYYYIPGTYMIFVSNKYNIIDLGIQGTKIQDLSVIQYCKKLEYINSFTGDVKYVEGMPLRIFAGYRYYGRLTHINPTYMEHLYLGGMDIDGTTEELANYTKMIQTYLPNNLTGDIKYLSTLTRCTRMYFSNNVLVTGEATELASRMAVNRTSGSMIMYLEQNHLVTVNGTTTRRTFTIHFGSSMVNPTQEETAQGWQIR